MRGLIIKISVLAVAIVLATPAAAAVPLEAEPSWESEDDDYATGAMLWDVDGVRGVQPADLRRHRRRL